MCGVVGIVGTNPVNQAIYDALTVLQHRGQDAAGIVTIDENNFFRLRKSNGLVKEVFEPDHMLQLQGHIGIGHVRYPTSGSASVTEAQPFYVNSPYGITLAHNGNLTNTQTLQDELITHAKRHINTNSDSEVLLNIWANELNKFTNNNLTADNIFDSITELHQKIKGAYACVALIIGYGLVGFRDPNGIRPLVIGKKESENGKMQYILASESVALDTLDFELLRDVAPGEAVYITQEGELFTKQCCLVTNYTPCIFEYVYFARPDSLMNGVSIYESRIEMGKKLGEKIAREWKNEKIDVVIPIPETSCEAALEIARILNKPYRQGFVKNRYVGRTFIMPGQIERQQSVKRKLNANRAEFNGKNVLLVDDSIVRGTTSQQIVEMARLAGANKVYFASAAPEIRHPNVYGIDMPVQTDLIAFNRNLHQIAKMISADKLIFQDLNDLIDAIKEINPQLINFESSVFDGKYVTADINEEFFFKLKK